MLSKKVFHLATFKKIIGYKRAILFNIYKQKNSQGKFAFPWLSKI